MGSNKVDFSSLNHHNAFFKLFEIITPLFDQAKFSNIRMACIFYVTSPDVLQYPSDGAFVQKITNCHDLNELVAVLSCYGYFNWFDTRLLKAMVDATGISEAKQALEKYDEHTSKMKLDETFESFPAIDLFPSSKYETVVQKFDKNASELTVGDIRKYQYQLEKLAITADIKVPKIKTGCVEILWLVPTEAVQRAYSSALANHDQFDAFVYLKFGSFPTIFSLKYVWSKDISTGKVLLLRFLPFKMCSCLNVQYVM